MTEPKIADPVPADPKVEQPKATHPWQRGGPPKCYEGGSTSHKWREGLLRKPTETPGKVPTASSLAITTHSESIDEVSKAAARVGGCRVCSYDQCLSDSWGSWTAMLHHGRNRWRKCEGNGGHRFFCNGSLL